MPVCHVCDAVDDFHDEDGLYYCNVCNTQSQSMQVLEQDDQYGGVSSGRFNMSQSMLAVKVPAKPRKELNIEVTKSKPWWSYEAFQIILKAQIDCLIALGISQNLSEVVKTIWFKYLQQSGVAFCSTSKEQMLAYRKMAEERELEIRRRSEAKKRKKLAESSKEGAESDGLAKPEGLDSGLDTEENMNSEAPDSDAMSVKSHGSARSARSNASTGSRRSGCSDRNTVYVRKLNRPSGEPLVAILSLKHLVCFLYLGLRYLGEPVIMNDLVRWINSGLLPYFGTEDLLPNYMVASMGSGDQVQFMSREIPSLYKCEKLWRSLTTFLNIKNLPPLDIRQLMSRFVLDLSLPREILEVGNRVLCHRNSRKRSQKEQPCWEMEALAIIVVALKLCFRLDDNVEHKQSLICRKIQQCCDAVGNYFVWDEWVYAQKLKSKVQQMNQVPKNTNDVLGLKTLESFIDFEKNTYKKWLGGQTSFQTRTSNRMETRMEMMKPFLALSDNEDAQHLTLKTSTFVHLHPSQASSSDNTVVHGSNLTYYAREAMLSKDFSVTSLAYAFKPKIAFPTRSKRSRRADSSKGQSLSKSGDNSNKNQEDDDEASLWLTQSSKKDLFNDVGLMPTHSSDCVSPSTDNDDGSGLSQSKLQMGTKRAWSRIKTLDCCNIKEDSVGKDSGDETGSSKKYRKRNLPVKVIDTNKTHTCKKLRKKLAKISRNHLYNVYPKLEFYKVKGSSQQVGRFHYSYEWLLMHLSGMVGQRYIELHDEVFKLEGALGLHKKDNN